MLEIAAFTSAFALVLITTNRRVHLVYAMFGAAGLVALGWPGGPLVALHIAWRAAASREAVELALTVMLITSLARLMQDFGLLPRMVEALVRLMRSTRLALGAVPGLVGLMPVPGGAVFSAPLVDKLADRLGFPPIRRAVVNLAFRHCWFFVYPFAPSLIMASRLSGVELGRLVGFQWPLTATALVAGYLLFLRRGPAEPRLEGSWQPRRDLPEFLVAGGPLLLSLALAMGCGLPLYAALGCGIALAVLVARSPAADALARLRRGLDVKMGLAMIGLMIFRRLIESSRTIELLLAAMQRSRVPQLAVVVLMPLLVGLVSASQTTSVGVCFPLLLRLAPPGTEMLPYTSLLFTVTYLAYFGSPLHMCQLLTLEHFGCKLTQAYRHYWPFLAAIAGTAVVLQILAAT